VILEEVGQSPSTEPSVRFLVGGALGGSCNFNYWNKYSYPEVEMTALGSEGPKSGSAFRCSKSITLIGKKAQQGYPFRNWSGMIRG